MIHQSKPLAKRAGMTPSRNYTLFDILLALTVLLFLLVSWNTAGAQTAPVEPTPVCITVEPDSIGCLIPPVTWVAPTATPVVLPTVRPFEPTATPTIVATAAGPETPTPAETPQPTPIHRCTVLRCVFLPAARK